MRSPIVLRCLFCLLVACQLSTTNGQGSGNLTANWIPTDLNYAMISRLSKNPLLNLTSQIAGYSILGVVTVQDVATWLKTMTQNPSVRTGTVNWDPFTSSRCMSGRIDCTKSIRITVLEFSYGALNATDCKAIAVVAADAILPPYATLVDSVPGSTNTFIPPVLPITYLVTASPNSTAQNCTYMITYPPATQNLANTLCFSGNNSCVNSTCLPCNANTTLVSTGPDPEINCTPQSGVSPGLTSAIEGAAQCLAMGGIGRFSCQVGFPANSPCTIMHCFPGDARVKIKGGKERLMQDLQIGDAVQTIGKDGMITYEEVYLLGHEDASTSADFISLTVQPRNASTEIRKLELTSHHFIFAHNPSAVDLKFKAVRARDVRSGWQVQISVGDRLEIGEVVATEIIRKQGLFNPYLMNSKSIIVNGVVASSHSEWLLDPILDRWGMTEHLPTVYQALLAPLRLFHRLAGKEMARRIHRQLDLTRLITPDS